jgi:hypothetical protein
VVLGKDVIKILGAEIVEQIEEEPPCPGPDLTVNSPWGFDSKSINILKKRLNKQKSS